MDQSYPRKIGPYVVNGTRDVLKTRWLRVREDQIIRPGGEPGTWAVIEVRPAVGVLALDADQKVHLVGQHRYAVDRFEWELPAGFIDPNESPLDAAKRELREEAGLVAKKWMPLGATHPLNGSSDSIYHLFLAQNLEQKQAAPEADEYLSNRIVSLSDLLGMVQRSEILDALTIVGVYRAWHHLRV